MTPVFIASGFLASSSSSNSSGSTSGVPFGTALLIAVGATIGFFVVPLVLYCFATEIFRCCKARRVRRQYALQRQNMNATAPAGTRKYKLCAKCGGYRECCVGESKRPTSKENGATNSAWPKPSLVGVGDGRGTKADWQKEASRSSAAAARNSKNATETNADSQPKSTLLVWSKPVVESKERDCEKGAAKGMEQVEEKENIIAAFVGFLCSWARVEGNGRV